MNNENNFKLEIDSSLYETSYTSKFLKRKRYIKNNPLEIRAFIPGIIIKLFVYEGRRIKKGDKLLILEAMKMENIVYCNDEALIKKIWVKENEVVSKNQLLIELEK